MNYPILEHDSAPNALIDPSKVIEPCNVPEHCVICFFREVLDEEVIAFGCRKFIVCGGCGVLEKDIAIGNLIVVSAAIRDEGVSYHYILPGREINANEAGVNALVNVLNQRGVPYRLGKTWSTDAPYRETLAKIARQKEEGCVSVEKEK
jgi:uridine phosphorylase